MTSINDWLDGSFLQDATGVWRLQSHDDFAYSDGRSSEEYLKRILESARNLSDGSPELENAIKDWPSEYHLSPKRSRLFSGFRFPRASTVLEVGCGCGAITRHLGENFREVVAVEGSPARANLARLRTRDLTGVSIVCAPFQNLRFRKKFDVIVCVGVLEYSASFIDGADPYDAVIKCFADWLEPGGSVFVAIENQFGLKYFSGISEDHLGRPYAGIEGYHGRSRGVRTFGRTELLERLQRRFPNVEFYYPFPDYKLPRCVISDKFLSGTEAGELVSQIRSSSYERVEHGLWDEGLVSLELARNRQLPFFANSFLAVASGENGGNHVFDQAAVLYADERSPSVRTKTRITTQSNGRIQVEKTLRSGEQRVANGPLTWVASSSEWHPGGSLQTELLRRCRYKDLSLTEIFSPCAAWIEALKEHASERDGRTLLPGRFFDAIWSNFYRSGGRREFVDLEWEWGEELPLNCVVIRAIHTFVSRLDHRHETNPAFRLRSGRRLTARIAGSFGITLERADFAQFAALEAEFASRALGINRIRYLVSLKWYLLDRFSLSSLIATKAAAACFARTLDGRVRRAFRFRP